MMNANFVLVVGLCWFGIAHAVECESGWTIYKDETCIKAFIELLSYNEAKLFCASKGNSLSSANLVMVKEQEMQDVLSNITQDIYEHMWLGAKYDAGSSQFKWEDGEPVSYSNWAEGYPRNISDPDVCIQFRPVKATTDAALEGNWEDAVCQRRNLVMCQRTVTWTIEDATREILKLRKRDLSLQEELNSATQRLISHSALLETAEKERNQLRQQIEELNAKVVPVGSIYIEYYNQPSPVTLWPTLQWEDVTSIYAGLFFRAYGGNSEAWGTTQMGCAPRLSHVQYEEINPPDFEGTTFLTLPEGGWSDNLKGGAYFTPGDLVYERFRYHVETCEVRPTNQAIKIWKRLA